jgi:glyoxylase-like metal-dependent hydrolase (beta-lactamase superfamily II)
MSHYEIYALKFAGPFVRPEAFLLWLRDWERTERIHYYIWCAKGPKATVVVDSGLSPQMAKERQLEGYENPAEVLRRIDVEVEQVRHVILTHLHWDHANGVILFPRATFYVQEAEYRFWIHDPVARTPPFLELLDPDSREALSRLETSGRLVLLPGEEEILPGVRCVPAPGHTPALQAVILETSRGAAVLGSDCAHLFRNFREQWPSILIADLAAWIKSYQRLADLASSPDLLFPGHDARMLEDFPMVATGVSRLV